MANKKKERPLIRATISVDPDDYEAMERLTGNCGLSTSKAG
jgi:hypothetical protein